MQHYFEVKSLARGPKYEWVFIAFMAVIVFVLYAKTLTGAFIFDDRNNITDNPHIRLTQITLPGIYSAVHDSPTPNRPLANISFALNYYFHRYNVVGYHAVNIIIHIFNGMLLYLFLKTTLATPVIRSNAHKYGWVPYFSAVIWLVHPIQTQSVSYIVQRMNSMAAMFYILSMLLYASGRLGEDRHKRILLFSGAAVSGILALGSKEIAATLPFFIFLYEWFFFQDLKPNWIKKKTPLVIAMGIILILLSIIYFRGNPLEHLLAGYATHHLDMVQRVLSQFRVVIFYISLLIWPHPGRLNIDHNFPPSYTLVDPISTVFAIVAILALLGLAFLLAKKERLISFCILWYLGNLVIESSVIGLELAFEHRNYLPSMLMVFMAVQLSFRFVKPKWLAALMLFAVATIFVVWTVERNDVWQAPELIWLDSVEKSPQNPRPLNNLGVALANQGRYQEATEQYHKALRLSPNYADAYANLGYALARQGKIADAISHFETALKIKPTYYEAHSNLGIALAIDGRQQEAIAHFRTALNLNPNFAEAHNNLGVALMRQGKLQEAGDHFSAALRLHPDFASAHNNLGMILARQGRLEEAITHFSEALRIYPDYASARQNLQESLSKQEQLGSPSNQE
jgi:Flp pilus assembly protein TadD